jgi:signal peptidase I
MKKQTGFLALAVAATALAGLRGRLRRYEIAEASMGPRLRAGDFVIAQRRSDDLDRGAVVIVPHPEIDDFELVKRVIGLPGEKVSLHRGRVHINDVVLAEPWANGPVRPDGEWTLGSDQVFVLGDNRPVSAADSRTLGPVPAESIQWKVVGRYWPARDMGRIT